MDSWVIALIVIAIIILVVILVKHHKTVKRREEDAHNPAPEKHVQPEAPVFPEAPAPMAEDPEIAKAAEDNGPITLE